MSKEITIVVYGNPSAQKRHRTFQSRGGGDKFGNIHVDPSARQKEDFLWTVQQQRPDKPFEGPLMVDMSFYYPRPKSHYGTGKNSAVLKPSAPTYYTSKPDIDNCIKFIMDSLNHIFWKDDAIICAGSFSKQYSENPRTEIIIKEL